MMLVEDDINLCGCHRSRISVCLLKSQSYWEGHSHQSILKAEEIDESVLYIRGSVDFLLEIFVYMSYVSV